MERRRGAVKAVEHEDNEWGIELGGSDGEGGGVDGGEGRDSAASAPVVPEPEPLAAPAADDSNLDDLMSELEGL